MTKPTKEKLTGLCGKLRAKKARTTDDLVMESDTLHLEDDNVASISDSLYKRSDRVQMLSLNISQLTGQVPGLESLLKYIETPNNDLREVRLLGSDRNNRSSSFPLLVKRFLVAIQRRRNLERLTLHQVGLHADSFAMLVRHSPALSHLSLLGCFIVDCGKPQYLDQIVDAFACNCSIISLQLVELDEDFLNSILSSVKSHAHQLRKLNVSYGSVASADAIGEVLGSSLIPTLRHLVLRDSSLVHLEPIVRNLGRIQKLEIRNCDLDSVSAALLRSLFRRPGATSHSTCTTRTAIIEDISFYDLNIEDESNLEDIFDGIALSSTVKRLRIHHAFCEQTMVRPGPSTTDALLKMLKTNQQLEALSLDRKLLVAIGWTSNNVGGHCDAGPVTATGTNASSKLFYSRRTGTTELRALVPRTSSRRQLSQKNDHTI